MADLPAICPYCFALAPDREHLDTCPKQPACINCGFVMDAHSVRARMNARAHGLVFLSCNLFTPYDGKPAKGRTMKPKRGDAGLIGQEGKAGRRARAELRNIARPKAPTVKRDARGRKPGPRDQAGNPIDAYCDCRNSALSSCLYFPCRQPPG